MTNKIPEELFEAYNNWVRKRKSASRQIKLHTDNWVEAQKNIIKIDEAIEALNKLK